MFLNGKQNRAAHTIEWAADWRIETMNTKKKKKKKQTLHNTLPAFVLCVHEIVEV